jgi:hypothetical protein
MMFADELSDDAIDAMLAATEAGTAPSLVHLRGLGGAFGRVPNDATAFAHRDRRYFVAVIGVWLDPAADPRPYEEWTLALWDKLRPEGRGVYVNALADEGAAGVRRAYGDGTYARLRQVKAAWDPENVFRLNQNIPPAA